MPAGSFVSTLTCSRCGASHDPNKPHNLCDCGGPLLVDYDLPAVGAATTREAIAGRISSMWRYEEMLPLTDPSTAVTLGEGHPPPRIIVVQARGCAPIVRAFEEGRADSEPWPDARTIAAGLRVPKPLGDALVLGAIRDTGGTAVAVDDEDIVEAMGTLARDASILAAPEGAATLAGAIRLRERGDLGEDDRVVLINTGTAAKYPDVLATAFSG